MKTEYKSISQSIQQPSTTQTQIYKYTEVFMYKSSVIFTLD